MGWFDDEQKVDPKQTGDVREYGPQGADGGESWHAKAQRYYSGGELYAPEYDIIFYAVHVGGGGFGWSAFTANASSPGHHQPAGDIRFRCWLTKFQDNFTSDWNSEHVYGRMDPIETFKGTKRIINLGFDVMASTAMEARTNQLMISALIRGLYPTYKSETVKAGSWTSSVGIIQTAPVWKLKLANLIQDSSLGQTRSAFAQGLMGRIAGISYTPNLDEGVFTGHLLGEHDKLYPQAVSLDIVYHVWHTHELGFSITHTPRSGFSKFPYAKSVSYSASGGGAGDEAGGDSGTHDAEAADASADEDTAAGAGGGADTDTAEIGDSEGGAEVAADVKDAEEKTVSEDVESEGVGGGGGDSATVLD